MSTEIVEQKPADMISLAVNKGANLQELKEVLLLQERWEANEARKAYHEAMAMFKANAPTIDKDKQVAYGNTKYNHASLANVTEKIGAQLSKWGLSATWKTSQTSGQITVTCIITHKKGHSEETSLSAAPDNSGQKNSIQAIGSAITYLERYTLLAMTGLATQEQDDDGAGTVVDLINEKQLHQLRDLIIDTKTDEPKFLAYLEIESLEKLPANAFQKAVNALEAKRKKKA
jgi:hypothetical protein